MKVESAPESSPPARQPWAAFHRGSKARQAWSEAPVPGPYPSTHRPAALSPGPGQQTLNESLGADQTPFGAAQRPGHLAGNLTYEGGWEACGSVGVGA